jgi:hypothetical protein
MKRLFIAALVASMPVWVAAAPQQGPGRGNGFRADFLGDLDEVESKIVALAEATPEAKFDWRPGKGIRSVGEVYGHMAGGNYFLTTFLGVATPASMPRDIEHLPGKARVISELRKSIAHVRAAARSSDENALDKRVKMFGRDVSHRFVYVRILNHLHEHLGQAIAYARMNNIVPPWSQ